MKINGRQLNTLSYYNYFYIKKKLIMLITCVPQMNSNWTQNLDGKFDWKGRTSKHDKTKEKCRNMLGRKGKQTIQLEEINQTVKTKEEWRKYTETG